ncbi:hypothetical protein GCM10023232_18120 [Sphingosinicella ginsenosidimutans]|uniref:hypothetical protein n=1 Tax=Allosphingosinicella ginsenosidimutans TaxID=1176539 RepID=UPI001FB14B8B|nr:hypothetical protein [Sphingosinicella ginsenosidimutans]
MKMLKLALAAAIAVGSIGMPAAPAAAQHNREWQNRHHGWHNRRHRRVRVCRTVWRHHHQRQVCRWVWR